MPHSQPHTLSDFDYVLPPELIAQHPLPTRSASRLLDAQTGALRDRIFSDLPSLLQTGDLLVFNDTRVIKARLFATKKTGGAVELLIERLISPLTALVQLRSSHAPKPGAEILIAERAVAVIDAREDRFFRITLIDPTAGDFETLMRDAGELPLPPYMQRHAEAADSERYQTVYARNEGAVAAPTAGLHFDEHTLHACRAAGIALTHVTLHVGAGTFLPVKTDDISAHVMHRERYIISAEAVDAIKACKARGGRVIAVGTTSLRSLEGCVNELGTLRAHSSETALFITPGFEFKVVDGLITNFHLPKSTLMMLVSAFAGFDHIRDVYAHAIAERYRFFSYGDAMLLQRASL